MIGKILKTMRKQSNLSQEQIAKLVGFARNTISQYETSTLQPEFQTIEKIAEICGYEIIFKNKSNEELNLTTKNINRKEL